MGLSQNIYNESKEEENKIENLGTLITTSIATMGLRIVRLKLGGGLPEILGRVNPRDIKLLNGVTPGLVLGSGLLSFLGAHFGISKMKEILSNNKKSKLKNDLNNDNSPNLE